MDMLGLMEMLKVTEMRERTFNMNEMRGGLPEKRDWKAEGALK